MKSNIKEKILYTILIIELLLVIYIILRDNYIIDSITISKTIEFIIIVLLILMSVLIIKYVRNKFKYNKYSYGIITALGFLIFIIINILRHSFLLLFNWHIYNKYSIYNNAIESFSSYIILTLPCIIVLAIYSMISNIVLIKREGRKISNLLGIFIAILAIIGLFGNQTIYLITSSIIKDNRLYYKLIIDIILNTTLVYLYSILLATLYCNTKAAKHIPKYDKDYIIILGCMIKKDGTLTNLLKGRVDKAIEFSKTQKEKTGKDIIFIPSGGQGKDEITSEAEAIKKYLLEQGIQKNKILVENKSKNTLENMKNSYEIIRKNKEGKICFSTTGYHVFRSGVTAYNIGINCEGMGSKTKWYFNTNAIIREFIATLVKDKKKHLIVIVLINISAILLIMIGYYYNLIRIN